ISRGAVYYLWSITYRVWGLVSDIGHPARALGPYYLVSLKSG
ncbi:unnamed protein product, partial [marine sediment metagenome]